MIAAGMLAGGVPAPPRDALLRTIQELWQARVHKLRGIDTYGGPEKFKTDECHRAVVQKWLDDYRSLTESYSYWLGVAHEAGYRYDGSELVALDSEGVRLVWEFECGTMLHAVAHARQEMIGTIHRASDETIHEGGG